MTERAHARLSPSSAERWSTCCASVQLEAEYPDSSSAYADEGTAAHAVAEMALSEKKDASAYVGTRVSVSNTKTVSVTANMADDVQKYINYIREVSEGHDLLLEQRLDISAWVPECFGTSDAVVLRADGELHVCDLKFGRGVRVSAVRNKQLILYGLGALEQFSLFGDFTHVRMTIHQPRLDHVSEWCIPVEELLAEGAVLKAAADRAHARVDSDEPLQVDDFQVTEKGCQFCKAKATCPVFTKDVAQVVSFTKTATPDDFEVVTPHAGLAPADLAYLMTKVDLVEAWAKAARAETERRLFAGQEVPGYKLVAGRQGPRKWTDEQAAEELLKSMRLKSDEMYDKKVISPTTAEKVLKEAPRRWAKAQELITRAEPSPSVAPADDKRPALVLTPPADDFDAVTVDVGDDLV